MMTTDLPRYFSPKRKREPSESDYYSPSISPTSTVSLNSLQEARFREEEVGRHSPRAAVAGRFGELAIRGERLADRTWPRGDDTTHKPTTVPLREPPATEMPGVWPEHNAEQNEKDPSNQSRTELPTNETITENPSHSLDSPSKKPSTPTRKQIQPFSPSKSRKQRLSPPLKDASMEDPFTWHDHEITGHDPTDPTDDGYGINGIGFKPTAATEWARSQKRQKQVAEWRSREAREAREKRREQRNKKDALERIHGIKQGSIQKRVKFDV